MKQFECLRLLLVILLLNSFSHAIYANDEEFPKTYLGKYGIQIQNNIEDYKTKYIGKTVKYIVGSYISPLDKEFPGVIGKEYLIIDVTGKGDVITLVMQEKGNKKKIKMPIRTANYTSIWNAKLKNIFNLSNKTVPLLLVDVFNEDKAKYIGKLLSPDSPTKLEIVDFYLTDTHYPQIMMKIKNHCDDSVYELDVAKNLDNLNYIGTIYRHPNVKAYYEVVAIKENFGELWLTVRNSITGETETYHSEYAESKCFEEDLKKAYIAHLFHVEKSSNKNVGEVIKDSLDKIHYTDNNIEVNINVTSKRINFTLKNISSSSLKVIWNEAVYVDSHGNTSKIMHSGIKYIDREKEQSPTTIIKGAKIEESVIPIDNVYRNQYGEWDENPLFLFEDKKNLSPIRLMLPIQNKDVIDEYIFIFNVKYGYVYPNRIIEPDNL